MKLGLDQRELESAETQEEAFLREREKSTKMGLDRNGKYKKQTKKIQWKFLHMNFMICALHLSQGV